VRVAARIRSVIWSQCFRAFAPPARYCRRSSITTSTVASDSASFVASLGSTLHSLRGFRRSLLALFLRRALCGFAHQSLCHRSFVALRKEHNEREPRAPTEVGIACLESAHLILASRECARVLAALDFLFRRASGEQRGEVIDDEPPADVLRQFDEFFIE